MRLSMRSMAAVGSLVAALAVGGQGPASAAAAPGRCGERTAVTVFRDGGVPLLDWRENLEFDGRGTLWVSHMKKDRVEGYAPDGTLRTSVPVPGPGGIRRGPDGMMYVNFGAKPPAVDGGVMRFDPAAAEPRAEKVFGGTPGINGLAIDSGGAFYLSRTLATGILKVRPDGTRDEEWTRKADVFGANGLEIVGDQLYASVLVNGSSPVVRVPLADPARHTTVTRLSHTVLDGKSLDDLTLFRGALVVAAFRSGELIRVDPATGRSCVLVDGLRMPTSVRVPRAFGDHDGRRELFVTEASGRVVRVTIG